MRQLWAALFALVLLASARADPWDAVVRQPSHGCSATIIWTGPGRSLLLGCGHAYEGRDRERPIVLDLPAPSTRSQPNPTARPRLIALDFDPRDPARDLSLVEIPVGPLPYVCPVAPSGFRPGRRVYTAGYPEMHPRSVLSAPIAPYPFDGQDDGKTTWTYHLPREGRSGGALIDAEAGVLIGVTQGYTTEEPRRGMYVSLAVIRRFLSASDLAPRPAPHPLVMERREFPQPRPKPQCLE